MVNENCILLGMDCKDQEEALRTLAQAMLDAGAVKETFPDAIVAREKVYPTGIPAKICEIAVPHTVGEHIVTPQMAVGILKEPVEFRQMGTTDVILHPRILFMMAITDPKEQLSLLQRLMFLIQNDCALSAILEAKSTKEVYAIVNQAIENK